MELKHEIISINTAKKLKKIDTLKRKLNKDFIYYKKKKSKDVFDNYVSSILANYINDLKEILKDE